MAVLEILGHKKSIIDSLSKGKGEVSNTPLDHMTNFHMAMGDAYYQIRNPEDAFTHYRKARESGSINYEREKQIESRMASINIIWSGKRKFDEIHILHAKQQHHTLYYEEKLMRGYVV